MSARPRGAGKDSFSLVDARALFAALRLEAGGLLVDLACGPGSYSLEAARRFPALRVQALDMAADLVDGLRVRAAAEGLANLRADVADLAGKLPLADATADSCLMAMIVHDLVADRAADAALLQVRRVLKPGGLLAVVEFLKRQPPPGPPLAMRLDPAELDGVLARAGFEPAQPPRLGGTAYMSVYRPVAGRSPA
ncbi:MAG TPA: class I SAM-dependent methyltransferase [Candidatus Aminicenantes bacterium]|nr:class I SAM-dependent methyltransferase [Candidatus Aminicenantes bacterium]